MIAILVFVLGVSLWLWRKLRVRSRLAPRDRDHLTGIANRGLAFTEGGWRCDLAQKEGQDLALLLMDVDHFSKINETLGHAAGDQTLLQLVEVTKGLLPPDALFARLGAEEFMVLLDGMGREKALDIAEDVRAATAAAGFLYSDSHPVNFTVSLGVACLAGDESFQHLVNRADEALYVAKHSGRNRVVMASSTAERLSQGKGAVGSRISPR